jgi:hypothetical protein
VAGDPGPETLTTSFALWRIALDVIVALFKRMDFMPKRRCPICGQAFRTDGELIVYESRHRQSEARR